MSFLDVHHECDDCSLVNHASVSRSLGVNDLELQLPKVALDEMANLGYQTGRSIMRQAVTSPDGTQKLLLQLFDGRVIEAVGIPENERLTVCVSSQVSFYLRLQTPNKLASQAYVQ